MAKISVVIPVYNTSKYIDRCLISLNKQTYNDFDIVIIDDGSTDDSLEKIENFKNKSKLNINILTQENMGVAKTRQRGIDATDSLYLAFIDSDDYIDLNYLEVLVNTLEKTDTNICCSRLAMHFNMPGIRKIPFKSRPMKLQRVDLFKDKKYLPLINVVTTCKLFKRDYIRITDKNFKANEDLSINYLNYVLAKDISFANDTSYHYLPNEYGLVNNNISGYSYDVMLNTFKPLSEMLQNFKKYHLAEYYSEEIEVLFIKNLFERIGYILDNVKDVNGKTNLINLIISYLEVYYPEWKDNVYFKNNFNMFEIPTIFNCLKVKRNLSKMNINTMYDSEDKILEKYKKYSEVLR